jgi:hypothetical protein
LIAICPRREIATGEVAAAVMASSSRQKSLV